MGQSDYIDFTLHMSENNKVKKPEKKRQRHKSKVSIQTKGAETNMANINPSVNKGDSFSSQTSGTSQVSNPSMFPAFGPFPQPSVIQLVAQPAAPSANYFSSTSFNQSADYNSKIDYIISKVGKLDAIEAQQSSIISRLSNIEAAVSQNKKMIEASSKKISDIENSQKFLSDSYDSVKSDVNVNKQNVVKLQADLKMLSDQNKTLADKNKVLADVNAKLKDDNGVMQEDIIDLKCRSMRDNMVFTGIPETFGNHTGFRGFLPADSSNAEGGALRGAAGSSEFMDTNQGPNSSNAPRSPKSFADAVASEEDCVAKIHDFCGGVLKIPNPEACIKIDRAHRMGSIIPGKQRPIVVKFASTASKMVVKSALQNVNLKSSPYNVFDQFPKIVQDRRKELIPIMVQASKEQKKAVLVRDKLYINSRLYKPNSPNATG